MQGTLYTLCHSNLCKGRWQYPLSFTGKKLKIERSTLPKCYSQLGCSRVLELEDLSVKSQIWKEQRH